MQRFKLTIEYDGTGFCGWQSQQNGVSVQGALEVAIGKFANAPIRVFGAGRTDTGVHAYGQVAHCDLATDMTAAQIRDATNHHIKPLPIAVVEATAVGDDFHARFSALKRHYLYRILPRRAPLTLDAARAWRVPKTLDAEAMQTAAQQLTGRHDFTSFRAAQCQADSPIRTLDALDVSAEMGGVVVRAVARSFLHNQVRSMVGALKYVGEGKWSERDLEDVLAACDRNACAPVAPAYGLYLMQVDYPPDAEK